MSNDLAQPKPLDSFADYDDAIEGDEGEARSRSIKGPLVVFTNDATYKIKKANTFLSPDQDFIAANVLRIETYWGKDNKPKDERVLGPGEKYRDLQTLNESIPRNEWGIGPDGKPRGPWQAQRFVILVDPKSLDTFTFASGTIGGSIAIGALVDKTLWMRRWKGAGVYPVVHLDKTWMNTQYGGRWAPHFKITNWVTLDTSEAISGPVGASKQVEQKPQTAAEQLDTFTSTQSSEAKSKTLAQTLTEASTMPGLKTVEQPTAKEVTQDEIPW
jgi:hypothetical protein